MIDCGFNKQQMDTQDLPDMYSLRPVALDAYVTNYFQDKFLSHQELNLHHRM